MTPDEKLRELMHDPDMPIADEQFTAAVARAYAKWALGEAAREAERKPRINESWPTGITRAHGNAIAAAIRALAAQIGGDNGK